MLVQAKVLANLQGEGSSSQNTFRASLKPYRLGDDDFVRDGHHRGSVLRSLGVETAEAYATEFRTQARGDAHGLVGMTVG